MFGLISRGRTYVSQSGGTRQHLQVHPHPRIRRRFAGRSLPPAEGPPGIKREAKSATGGTRPVQGSNPMSVKADTSGRRFVQVEVEVPGTPEPR